MRFFYLYRRDFFAFFNSASDLIELLGGEARFCDDVALGLGEAIEEVLVVADADNVTDFIEVEVGVYGVGEEGLLSVGELSVTALKKETVLRMAKPSATNVV